MTGKFARSAVAVLVLLWSAVWSATIAAQGRETSASAKSSPRQIASVNQMALTEAQVRGVLAAAKTIDGITDNAPEDIDKLSAETIAKLDAVAITHGFASYAEYKSVTKNIGLISAGIDPVTKKYIGREAVIRAQIARVRVDKKMSSADKKETLAGLNDQLQFALPPLKYKSNIALVLRYSDALSEVIRGE